MNTVKSTFNFLVLLFITLFVVFPVNAKDYKNAKYKFIIRIPEGYNVEERTTNNIFSLRISTDDESHGLVITAITHKKEDSRFKYSFYETLDTCLYHLPVQIFEKKYFFNGCIDRKYQQSQGYYYRTRSVYAKDVCYVILQYSLTEDDEITENIVNSFYSTHHGGPVNFISRCIYQFIADNAFGDFIIYLIFSLGFTFLFWGGIYYIVSKEDDDKPKIVQLTFRMIIFIITFAYIAVHNVFIDFLYGFSSIWKVLANILLLFLED